MTLLSRIIIHLILQLMQHISKFLNIFLLAFIFILSGVNIGAQEDDTLLWRAALGGSVIGHPIAEVNSVVVITDGGNLRSYSSEGRLLWDYFARGRLSPFLSRTREGTSYISRTNGILIAVNRSGRELWQINMGSPLIHPVLIGWDGRLFIFTQDRISCITAAGFPLWTRNLEKNIILEPFLDVTGGIILVMEDGEIRRFSPYGSYVSFVLIERERQEIPVAASSVILPERGASVILLHENRQIEIIYLAPDSAEEAYGISLRGILELPSIPFATTGISVAGSNITGREDQAAVLFRDGRVGIISFGRREILWTAASHAREADLRAISSTGDYKLLFDERGVYLLTKTGVSSFDLNGNRLWNMSLSERATAPALGDDGILFSGGNDWLLYAHFAETRARPRQSLLFGEEARGTYGLWNFRPSSPAYYMTFNEAEIIRRLDVISRAIQSGNIGTNETEYALWLMEIAGIYVVNPVLIRQAPISVFYRVEALRLLAFIGSRESIAFLVNIFNRDPDPNVRAAAARTIGRIGVDPEGLAVTTFSNAVFPPSPLTDEVILTAIAESTGALCRFSGPPLSETGVRILASLTTPERPPLTRRQALREITSF